MALSFLFGGNTKETPESIKRKRDLAMAIMGTSAAPKNIGEGLNALGSGIVAGVMNRRANKAEIEGQSASGALRQQFYNSITGQAPDVSASSMLSPNGGNGGSVGVSFMAEDPRVGSTIDFARGAASGAPAANMSGNDIYSGFMDTVDDTITNPFGLAAVAATGQAESRFSPGNVNRTWSDPSESGQAGTAGGIMSWRGPRLEALQTFAAKKGEQGNGSPQTQAEFLLQEDPNLITALNNAKSVEEAQQLMNRAWQFAGWNRPGGEAAERLSSANAFLPKFQSLRQPQEVASLDPAIGMPGAAGEVTATSPQPNAPAPGNVDPMVSAPNYDPVAASQPVVPNQQPGEVRQPQQVAQAQPQQSGPSEALLYQILTHPFSTSEDKAMAKMMLEQRMQTQQSARDEQLWRQRQQYEAEQKRSDPGYQLGLEKTRQEVENLKTPEYQTLTPEERKALGIAETDQRVYQRSRGGKIDAVGGAGQTINVGNEVDARKAAAESLGLTPQDPRYQSFILTGKFPREDAQSLTATDKKAILEADEMVAANQSALDALSQAEGLSDKANSGWFAGARASIGNNLPDWIVPDIVSSPQSSQATTDMDNAIIGQAITQLKTIFGGNPTEGERNILLELQGSSTMPRDVRKQVFSRARALAEKRLQFNNDRAADLRGGTYYKPDRAPATGQSIDDLLKKYGAQ